MLSKTSDNVCRPSVATIGFFDGVHRGHRYLIEQVCKAAAARGLAASVVTFPVHPRKVMHADYRPELLTTCDEKVALLAETGIDYCFMLDFTPTVAQLSAKQFMSVLKKDYDVQALVIGYDHRFGHNRSDAFEDYVRYGGELGIEVLRAHAYPYGTGSVATNLKAEAETTVSSSAIRRLLLEGNVSGAADCLGYRFFLEGTVVGGHRIGRKIGFPTANLRVSDSEKLIPCDGVYAVRVHLEGKEYGGMLSIGCRPTLNNGANRTIEVHLFHFNGDIYGWPMQIAFVRRTRPELKFDSIDGLVEQLRRDEAEIKAILSAAPLP